MSTTPASGQLSNVHATALVIGRAGILVSGPSGAGKTTLALELVATARAHSLHAALVSDDRTILRRAGARIVAEVPSSIAGMAEIHFLGPLAVESLASTLIDLSVELVEDGSAPRYQDPREQDWLGVALPSLVLPARGGFRSVLAIAGWLTTSGHLSQSFAG